MQIITNSCFFERCACVLFNIKLPPVVSLLFSWTDVIIVVVVFFIASIYLFGANWRLFATLLSWWTPMVILAGPPQVVCPRSTDPKITDSPKWSFNLKSKIYVPCLKKLHFHKKESMWVGGQTIGRWVDLCRSLLIA